MPLRLFSSFPCLGADEQPILLQWEPEGLTRAAKVSSCRGPDTDAAGLHCATQELSAPFSVRRWRPIGTRSLARGIRCFLRLLSLVKEREDMN